MHIFNVSTATVQSLKIVNLKVWEELITQSKFPIRRRPPARQHAEKMIKFNYM
jgi:hypothetical protein